MRTSISCAVVSEFIELIRKDPVKVLGSVMPAEEDLHGAANALFRLQDTYDLKARVLSDGQLMDTVYTEKLSGRFFTAARILRGLTMRAQLEQKHLKSGSNNLIHALGQLFLDDKKAFAVYY